MGQDNKQAGLKHVKHTTKKKAAFLAAMSILGGTQLASAEGPFTAAATGHVTTMTGDVTTIGIAMMSVFGLIAIYLLVRRMIRP